MIEVDNLTRRYDDVAVVDQVSFSIEQGEIVGLLGRNGAGKTTIMKMLTGFLEPTSGTIRVDGLDMTDNRSRIQGRIGYLPENCPVYPELTVIDYLDYAAALHRIPAADRSRRLRTALERTDLSSRADRRISTLSRGYRQRVGVTQAILHQPQILILDEPTNGLDPAQILQMRELIAELARESTVIVSTHILQEVEATCDRVIIIQDGRKALDERLDALQAVRRLEVRVDLPPDKAIPLFKNIDGIETVHQLASGEGVFLYGLGSGTDPGELTTAVARALLDQGARLYSLAPESRTLETIFKEITEPKEKKQ